ncbi:Arf-GAP with Rho-GAP domain, ANK repeat and PH domain-containing protein 2 [Liparis tanakae]|uniref:Arf-GAP with Rho-GAP domain, ANK repeat and PH domain-containing protein 2 n=1 Tax=Liparis tanakae TaxID=230148 RepID=A0A4Z2GZ46_9TELE|nr:Arf-GAP with Rho-GAP domain, ANK repeat and PH domain-containing protein 2 [Liparis tanakae]
MTSRGTAGWLSTLRLSQYAPYFQSGGYAALEDCRELTDDRLLGLNVFPTGHRRRILRSLEALGVKKTSGGEEDHEEVPVPHPRHVFLKDKKRGASCRPQPKERGDRQPEASRTLPPGAGLGTDLEGGPAPQPAPRDPRNIQRALPGRTSVSASSSSSDSLFAFEVPSDGGVSSEDSSPSAAGGFQGDMVDNSIYEAQPHFKKALGPRVTRSYRLRHRPVPNIPDLTAPPLQDRKKMLKRRKSKEHVCHPAAALPDPHQDEYSTVDECAGVLPRAASNPSVPANPEGLAASGPEDGPLTMVECDLYSDPADALGRPDISPYACFYGAPKHQVLKAGWLDKLSPQGNCVFQRRWVRFDGESLAYYNNDKPQTELIAFNHSRSLKVSGCGGVVIGGSGGGVGE